MERTRGGGGPGNELSRGFREKHLRAHRRIGPSVLGAGFISGIFALLFGVPHAFGGAGQAAATVVFGTWFLVALSLAFVAIRRGNVRMHRQWMIRAFAIGIGVGSIRIWIGLLEGTELHDRAGGVRSGVLARPGYARPDG
jgi:uncharacterized membrane protein